MASPQTKRTGRLPTYTYRDYSLAAIAVRVSLERVLTASFRHLNFSPSKLWAMAGYKVIYPQLVLMTTYECILGARGG